MFNRILCLITVICFLLTGVCAFADTELTNLASGKTVTVSGGTGAGSLLTDGTISTKGADSWCSDTSGLYFVINLSETTTFNSLKIYELSADTQRINGYKIEVSSNNLNWNTVLESDKEYTFTESTEKSACFAGTLAFETQTAQYLKFTVKSSLKKWYIQEIEIYNDPDAVITVPPVDDETVIDDSQNFARGKDVTASNIYSSGAASAVTDGTVTITDKDTQTCWVKSSSAIIIDLKEEKSFDCVIVYEYSVLRAQNWKMEYSSTGNDDDWHEILSGTDVLCQTGRVDTTVNGPHFVGQYTFDEVTGRYFKLTIGGLMDGTVSYIEEIEIYNQSNMPELSIIPADVQVDEELPEPVVYESEDGDAVLPENYTSDNFHIYLFIGQSNMSGRGAILPEDFIVHDNAFLLNSDGKWEKAQPYNNSAYNESKGVTTYQGYNRYSTVESESQNNRNNPALSFTATLRENISDDIGIGIICNAEGGTSIEKWQENSGEELYEEAIRRTNEALKLGGVLKGILWHQGDSCASKDNYFELLNTMVTSMRNALNVTAEQVPFIAGQYVPVSSKSAQNENILNISKYVENSDCVLNTGTDSVGDNLHFDGKSQRILGIRYAQKILDKVYGINMNEDELFSSAYLPENIPQSFSDATAKFPGKAEESAPLEVINHSGESQQITGEYISLAARFVETDENYTLQDYGFAVSLDNKNFTYKASGQCKSVINNSSSVAFGVLFYNLKPAKTYYFKPYAIYKDSNDKLWYKFGSDITTYSIDN